MALPPNKFRTLSFYLDFDEEVDYASDTNVYGDEGTSSYSFVPGARPLSALKSFVKSGNNTAPGAQHYTIDAGKTS